MHRSVIPTVRNLWTKIQRFASMAGVFILLAVCLSPAFAGTPTLTIAITAECSEKSPCVSHVFGAVLAVGSAQRVVFNDAATPAGPAPTLSDAERLMLLAASLDNDQWQAFTGDAGLALSDLNQPQQQALFLDFFRQGTLKATLDFNPGESLPVDQLLAGVLEVVARDPALSADDPDSARMRLVLRPVILLPVLGASGAGEQDAFMRVGVPEQAGAPPEYHLVHTMPADVAEPALSAITPNEPVDDQLDASAESMNRPVAAHIGTVADLLAAVRKAGGPEVYAHPMYEKLMVSVSGSGVVPAGDLLRAVAFAVAGTFRKVGPAYSLTADEAGAGVRAAVWASAVAVADAGRTAFDEQASPSLAGSHTPDSLDQSWSVLALSADEMELLHPNRGTTPEIADVPRSMLTPAQQDYLQRATEKLARFDPDVHVDPNAALRIELHPRLQVLIPSLDGPVEIDPSVSLSELFDPRPPAEPASFPPPAIASLLNQGDRRAVIAAPTTSADAARLVAAVHRAGMNEIWIQSTDAATVAACVSNGKRDGISVRCYVDALAPGQAAQSEQLDLDIFGNSKQADGSGSPYLTPFSPAVTDGIKERVKSAAAAPGIAGIAVGSLDPPGYADSFPEGVMVLPFRCAPRQGSSQTGDDLGYAPAGRLAFLRFAHADPLDVLPSLSVAYDGDLRRGRNETVDDSLTEAWSRFRLDALRRVANAATQAAEGIPVLVEAHTTGPCPEAFISWSLPAGLQPAEPTTAMAMVPALNATDPDAVSRVLSGIPIGERAAVDIPLLATPANVRWDGYVIDLRGSPEAAQTLADMTTQ